MSRSPSFMGRPLKWRTLREDVKKEQYYEFYLPRKRECFFLTSGLVKGTSENYSEALLDILYGGGTICLESFKRCSFQEGFLPEWGDSRVRDCGVYWQGRKRSGGDVQPGEEAAPASKELKFERHSKGGCDRFRKTCVYHGKRYRAILLQFQSVK